MTFHEQWFGLSIVWMRYSGNRLIRHGKYRLMSFEDLAVADKDYVSWCLRSESLPSSLREFVDWIKERYGGLLTAGRYKRMYFSDVIANYPEYTALLILL